MNEKQIRGWEAIREKGMVRFVLLRGVLGWGLFMFVIMTFLVNGIRLEETGKVFKSLGVWMLGGALFGFWMWMAFERIHRKSSKDGPPGSP